MQDLSKLRDMLCRELEEYARKNKVIAGDIEAVDTLAHAIKNLDKIIEKDEREMYSGRSYAEGGSYRPYAYEDGGMSNDDYANARGRGAGARRDSMGRYSSERGYSRNDNMVMELRELMDGATDERTRREFQQFINKIESM